LPFTTLVPSKPFTHLIPKEGGGGKERRRQRGGKEGEAE
jgi:hypothetical protein